MTGQPATAREGAAAGEPTPVGRTVKDKDGGHRRAACNHHEDRDAAEQTVVDGKMGGTEPLDWFPRQARDLCERESQEAFWRSAGAVVGHGASWASHVTPTKPHRHVFVSSPSCSLEAMA